MGGRFSVQQNRQITPPDPPCMVDYPQVHQPNPYCMVDYLQARQITQLYCDNESMFPPDPPYTVHNQQVRQFTPHHRARAAQLAAAMLDYERSPDLITPPDPPMNIIPDDITL
jgi:hypothetical protein